MSSWLCLLGSRGSRWLFLSDQFPLRRDWLLGFRDSWHCGEGVGEGLTINALAGTPCLLGLDMEARGWQPWLPQIPPWNFYLLGYPLLRPQLQTVGQGQVRYLHLQRKLNYFCQKRS